MIDPATSWERMRVLPSQLWPLDVLGEGRRIKRVTQATQIATGGPYVEIEIGTDRWVDVEINGNVMKDVRWKHLETRRFVNDYGTGDMALARPIEILRPRWPNL